MLNVEKLQRRSIRIVHGPTVFPDENFDVNQDAENIREAMKGLTQNNSLIGDILCNRSEEQRLKI
jgi:hypothetical protein